MNSYELMIRLGMMSVTGRLRKKFKKDSDILSLSNF